MDDSVYSSHQRFIIMWRHPAAAKNAVQGAPHKAAAPPAAAPDTAAPSVLAACSRENMFHDLTEVLQASADSSSAQQHVQSGCRMLSVLHIDSQGWKLLTPGGGRNVACLGHPAVLAGAGGRRRSDEAAIAAAQGARSCQRAAGGSVFRRCGG